MAMKSVNIVVIPDRKCAPSDPARVGRGVLRLRLPSAFLLAIIPTLAFLSIIGLAYVCGVVGTRSKSFGAMAADQDYVKALQRKIDDLSDRVMQVKKYEDDLKLRASALRTAINEAKVLDPQVLGGNDPAQVPPRAKTGRGGLGGGSEFRSPMFTDRSPARIAKAPKDRDLLSEVDRTVELLRWIPVGAPLAADVTSGFGYRRSPFSRAALNGGSDFHSGLDFAADMKSPVVAVADGVVVEAGRKGAYGNAVVIDHGDRVETLYGHLSKITVQEGERVCRGKEIGEVGSTGNSTGPHLHYEVRVDGVPKNPVSFVQLAKLFKMLL